MSITTRARRRIAAAMLALSVTATALATVGAAAPAHAEDSAAPRIDHVSQVVAQTPGLYSAGPVLVIDGAGFGSTAPTLTEVPSLDDTEVGQSALGRWGNTRHLQVIDDGTFATDHAGLYPSDDNNCYVTIGRWTDTQIVVMLDDAGIDSVCSAMSDGNDVSVEVWSTDGGGYGASPGSGTYDVGEAQEVGDLATIQSVSPASGPTTGGTFGPDGTADPDGVVTVTGDGLADASVLWFGEARYWGAAAVPRCDGGETVEDGCFTESDGALRVVPPAAPRGSDRGAYLGVTTPDGTSHLDCASVFTCDGGVFYYQTPSTVFPSFDKTIQVGYPNASIGFAGSKDVEDASCPGSAPSGPTGISYSVTATLASGRVRLRGTPLTSVNGTVPVISSLQVPLQLDIEEKIDLEVTLSGTISGCAAIPLLGGMVDGKGAGLYMMIGGNLDGSYTLHVTVNRGKIDMLAGYVPGQLYGAEILSQDCVDDDDEPVPCLQVSHDWNVGGSIFFSPLWVDVTLKQDPFEFSAGAGVTVAARLETGSQGSGYELCYGGSYQVTAAAEISESVSFEYNNAGPFWGPFHLAGNLPGSCPLGEITVDAVETSTTVSAGDPAPTAEGVDVLYTATVEPSDATGTVAFTSDGEPVEECEEVPVVGGVATCTVHHDTAGLHGVGAAYSGDGGFVPSVATTLWNHVPLAAQAVELTVPPTAAYGDEVPVGTAGGGSGQPVTVTVVPGSEDVCRLLVDPDDGTATLRMVGVGTCRVVARQAAGGGYAAAPETIGVIEVERAQQTLTLETPAPDVTGGHAVLAVVATGTEPVVSVDPASADVCAIDPRLLEPTVVYLGAGTCLLEAVAPADDHYTEATDSVFVPVGRAGTTTHLNITPETLTASVTPDSTDDRGRAMRRNGVPSPAKPGGTVAFTVDGRPAGVAPLVDGTAVLAAALGTRRDHLVVATYVEDGNYLGSTDQAERRNPQIGVALTSEVPPTAAGWYRTPIRLTFSCTATTAPLVGRCPGPALVRTNGRGRPLFREVTAADGGRGRVTVRGLRIDTVAPRIDYVGRLHPRPGRSPVVVRVRDPLSGIATKHTRVRSRQTPDGLLTIYRTVAVDNAGNRTVDVYRHLAPEVDEAGSRYQLRPGADQHRLGRTWWS